jgi:Rrf2 family protein
LLSLTAKYAIRALSELAALPQDTTLLGKDLSKRSGVPPNYLSKILWTLGGQGLIDATRGIRGGYRLARPPAEIPLGEIVRLFDKPHNSQTCFLYNDRPCSDVEPCSAHQAWTQVGEANRRFLELTTLADISHSKSTKKRRRAG